MAIFDRLDKMTSRTVDRVSAIPFKLTPMASTPNGRAGEDPSRSIIEGKGIFDDLESEYGIQLGVRKSYREANDLRSLQVGSDPRISIDLKYFPTMQEWPRQGDIIEFPSRPDKPRYDVASAQPDSMNRIVLMLVQRGVKP